MSNNFFTVKKGLNVDPQSATTLSTMGDVQVDVSTGKMLYHNGTSASAKVTEAHAATLTNKSIDASLNTISNLVDANIKSGAAIAYAKLALTGSIINSDIGASAAIAYSKLNLATSITNSDVATAAAIAYSKLNLVSSIVNADIASGAAIAYSKLALTASIVNADIGAAAAIAYSKLALTGAITGTDISSSAAIPYSKLALTNSILNADIGAAAAIAYSKLNLATSIVNADIATGAAIARAKIATGTAGQVLINDGSGFISGETNLAPSRGGTGTGNAGVLSYGGNNITLTTGGATALTLPTSGTLATLAGTETLSNKTLSDKLTMAQIATPATPSSGFNSIYPKSDGFFYSIDPTGAERKIGAGNGAINYITNSDFEGGTTGYAAYLNTAQSTPVTGTGGSPTVTITRTTTTPLRGVASGLITKTAVNSQGQGVSYAFTTDSADASKVLTISMDYTVDSGTYADGDLTAYIYDVTNAVVIQPVGYSILSASSGNKARLNATFQTSSNSTSYRLCFHVASTSTAAYALKIDNLSVGPVPVIQGAVITDWTSFTPVITGSTSGTFSAGTTGIYTGVWARVGSEAIVRYTITPGGTGAGVASGQYIFSTPPGLALHSSLTAGYDVVGYGDVTITGSAAPVARLTAKVYGTGFILDKTDTTGLQSSDGLMASTSNTTSVYIRYRVAGWGAMASLGGADDARQTVALIAGTTGVAPAANGITIVPTVVKDTHAGYNTTTGQYTAPSSGFYEVKLNANLSQTGAANWNAYVAGSPYTYMGLSNNGFVATSGIVYANAGQTIDVRTGTAVTSSSNVSLSFTKLTGSATIQASESVNAKLYNTSFSGTTGIIILTAKVFDSHNAYNSTTGIYTFPVGGVYEIGGFATTNAVSFGINQGYELYASINGGGASNATNQIGGSRSETTQAVNRYAFGSTIVRVNAGDTLSLYQNSPVSVSPLGPVMTIKKVGN